MPRFTVSFGYLTRQDKFDFGPRIGIAYRIMNKTVLRIGYGVFYGGEENQGGSPNRGEGVPFNGEPVPLPGQQRVCRHHPGPVPQLRFPCRVASPAAIKRVRSH